MPDLPPLPYSKPVNKGGRPATYTPELGEVICLRISEGRSLRSVCEDEDMPCRAVVHLWLVADEKFRSQYTAAVEARADVMADEILKISDDGLNDTYTDDNGNERANTDVIQRSKLRVDTRKWLMGRMAPKKYGDKIEQTLKGDADSPVVVEVLRLAPDAPHSTS